LGTFIDQPDGSLGPIHLNTANNYYGFYASDTFNVTPQLAVTLGGRYSLDLIQLVDKIGTALSGSARFSRFNPSVGATYKITPNVTGYFNFAQANRAPTPGEIACSDPTRPCSLDLFLTSDPPGLQQVVATTYETGLRGTFRGRKLRQQAIAGVPHNPAPVLLGASVRSGHSGRQRPCAGDGGPRPDGSAREGRRSLPQRSQVMRWEPNRYCCGPELDSMIDPLRLDALDTAWRLHALELR
jgi:hypothetical protein